MLSLLETIGSWLRAIPGPTAGWAQIISAFAWPLTVAIIVRWFRGPLFEAARLLAARFGRDAVKIGGLLEITQGGEVVALAKAATGRGQEEDAVAVQALFDFIAAEDVNLEILVRWLAANVGGDVEPFDFIYDAQFASDRMRAYIAFIEDTA